MRFYVAAPRELIAAASGLIGDLTRAGHQVTYDWTEAIRNNPPDDRCTHEVLLREANRDVSGVRACQVLIVLGSEKGGTGVWYEMGLAGAWGRPTHYIGPFRTIFEKRYNVEVFRTMGEWFKKYGALYGLTP